MGKIDLKPYDMQVLGLKLLLCNDLLVLKKRVYNYVISASDVKIIVIPNNAATDVLYKLVFSNAQEPTTLMQEIFLQPNIYTVFKYLKSWNQYLEKLKFNNKVSTKVFKSGIVFNEQSLVFQFVGTIPSNGLYLDVQLNYMVKEFLIDDFLKRPDVVIFFNNLCAVVEIKVFVNDSPEHILEILS